MSSTARFNADVQAFIDGELPPEKAEQVLKNILEDKDLYRQARLLQKQTKALKT